ncbi:hypothetical protein RRG08_010800 [Elysia crispata]|uniref:Uncharacterized protein n=1 Tax=Elysia crispata TaxID=231223 RepID=A0AAE0ZFA6_9GAST|nr:hypothetical protein RRG08_010800 [Elysia crispata]
MRCFQIQFWTRSQNKLRSDDIKSFEIEDNRSEVSDSVDGFLYRFTLDSVDGFLYRFTLDSVDGFLYRFTLDSVDGLLYRFTQDSVDGVVLTWFASELWIKDFRASLSDPIKKSSRGPRSWPVLGPMPHHHGV